MAKPDYASMAKQLNLTPQSAVDAIDDLNEWICLHAKFLTTQQKIMNAIAGRSRDLLIVVIGPARVGKTTLLESIAGMSDALALERGQRRGCFRFSVPPPDHVGRFNWTEAIINAYVAADEPLPYNKIEYGDVEHGAPRGRAVSGSVAARDAGLWHSFVKNIKLEKLVTVVDEGNTIPVTLSDLQVSRAIHALKYIVALTKQPLVIGGTSNIKRLVEHDVQLKTRTKLIAFEPYSDTPEDNEAFEQFLDEMEKRLGPDHCEPGCLVAHAQIIRKSIDGRPGLAVRVATDALSEPSKRSRLTWNRYQRHLNIISSASLDDLTVERHVTAERIVAAAEAVTTRRPEAKKRQPSGRVGATRNSNAPNHPFE
ncbi:hypothetical protein P3T18_002980 [Paraburkholderia sp. GAS199]|uniref:hypothetical protein n=1 Tax=Paraburkholderia sp. GAS199 TaxID=3035126 RepID=UPI003D1B5BA3